MKVPYIQALKSKHRDQASLASCDSRSPSPRDSGLAVSSTAGSDVESEIREVSSPVSMSPLTNLQPDVASFKNSLNFFQKAANLVSPVGRHSKGHRSSKENKRRGSQANKTSKVSHADGLFEGKFWRGDPPVGGGGSEEDFERVEDPGTFEQVLFINGRPLYTEEVPKRSRSYDPLLEGRDQLQRPSSTSSILVQTERKSRNKHGCAAAERSRSCSCTRVQISDSGTSAVVLQGDSRSGTEAVSTQPSSCSHRRGDGARSYLFTDSVSVTLPKRKPVLNFGSVSSDFSKNSPRFHKSSEFLDSSDSYNKESDLNKTVYRAQSYKEGLDYIHRDQSVQTQGSNLARAQSCQDGLAGDFNGPESGHPKLRRVPSVDEILESVKSLRAKKTMVKSEPDVTLSEKSGTNSSSRHKNSKNRSSKSSSGSSKKRTQDSSYIHDYETLDQRHYYENLPTKAKEVIYDKPKKPERYYERIPGEHYEDQPVYENVLEDEPTYMNVTNTSKSKKKTNSSKKSKTKNTPTKEPENTYANVEEAGYTKGSLTRITVNENQTYDVPRAATHIYDVPPNKPRKVKETTENNYDTPRNNKFVNTPSNRAILQKAKNQQIKKIEDIFADCERDSLDGDGSRREPDIPSPDYGSEEESEDRPTEEILQTPRDHKATSTSVSEYIDEGLGESDSRSYYADDQGLEVILEEPEEDYCSSHTSEEDIRREVGLRLGLKAERRSLDGSEGIGSAEGDSQSSGSELGAGEEDCASSGIHSEDTPSPGPQEIQKDEPSTTSLPKKEITLEDEKKKKEEERIQKDRCIEIYPETLRQRQRNMAPSPTKVDIKNFEGSSEASNELSQGKKFLPSVKALRNQFENGNVVSSTPSTISSTHTNGTREAPPTTQSPPPLGRTSSNSSSTSSLNNLTSLETSSGFSSIASSQTTTTESTTNKDGEDDIVEPIFNQFKQVDQELKELMSKPPSTSAWNAMPLVKKLYYVPDAPKMHSKGSNFISIEGYLEKLPSGRKKATFWNAWKRRYFQAKDGILYYYQNNQMDKQSMKLSLMGGKVEMMDPNMVSVDDGKGHYVVVRCSSRPEAERWKKALESHTVDDFSRHFVQPWPRPTNPTLLRDTLIIDLGSCSVRAGVLASQATLPQIFFPSVLATHRETKRQHWGFEAISSDVRSTSSVSFPIRPSHKISKYSVDLTAASSLIQKAFNDLKVDPKNYNIQLSVPRVLNPHTQAELLKIMFEKFGVKSVNLTHQSILALYAYNATSGIVVDIGERLDVVPVIDGYIVDGGVSRVPYGGYRILEHLRQFLFQRNVSLVNEVESYVLRSVLESICYCAQHYNTEKARCTNNPHNFETPLRRAEYQLSGPNCEAFQNISLDFGRFQATEGIFNPDAWGLDHPGLHKLVHKAIQECSMDIRKEMSRSIFLAGGVSQLPGLAERLSTELDNLTPTAMRPKVHASPYRYHAAYLGACVLAESPAFAQSKINKEEWLKQGNSVLRKWAL